MKTALVDELPPSQLDLESTARRYLRQMRGSLGQHETLITNIPKYARRQTKMEEL